VRRTSALCLAAALVVATAACGGSGDGTSTGGATDAPGSTAGGPLLEVCTDPPYEVFEFGEPPDLDGFDVELVELVAARLDRPVAFVVTPFDQFGAALADGSCELVASALPVDTTGTSPLAFSAPYLLVDQAVVVRSADAAGIDGAAGLAGRTVGVVEGSAGADLAAGLLPPDTRVETFLTWTELEGAVRRGEVDAALGDGPLADRAALVDGGLTVVERAAPDVAYALATAPSATALLTQVDAALAELVADGSLAELRATWFGR